MTIRTVVWGENVHDRENETVKAIYPKGMHGAIADALNADPDISASTATLDQPEHGLPVDRLKDTDVLTWWGHRAHGEVSDAVVDRVAERVWEGMGLIVLHSGHFSKIFKRLMGSPCSLKWREAGEGARLGRQPQPPDRAGPRALFHRPRYRDVRRALLHPRADGDGLHQLVRRRRGVPLRRHLPARRRAHLSISRPGRVYPIYHDKNVQTVLRNAVNWAYNPARWPKITEAPERIERAGANYRKGPRLHKSGEATLPLGFTTHGQQTSHHRCRQHGAGPYRQLQGIEGVSLVAAVETNAGRLKTFSDEHGIANRFADLDAASRKVSSTPPPTSRRTRSHHPTTMKLIAAGKERSSAKSRSPRPTRWRRGRWPNHRREARRHQHGQP